MRVAAGISVLVLFVASCSDPVSVHDPICLPEGEDACWTWTFLGLADEWVVEVAATPWGVFAGTADHGIFRLEENGDWTALGPQAWHNRLMPQALLYVPTDPPRLLAGLQFRHDSRDTTRATVYASFDRGETWVPSDGGLASGSAEYTYRVFASDLEVDPGNPQRVLMSNCHGVLQSLDAGQSWEFVLGSFNLCDWNVDVLIDPNRTGRVWVAGQGNLFNPRVAFSRDWGDTWDGGVPICDGSVFGTAEALALDPSRPNRLWAAVSHGVVWADDGAEAELDGWQCGSGPRGAVGAFAELDAALYAATAFVEPEHDDDGGVREITELGLYRTADGGASWDSLAVPASAQGATSTATTTDPAGGRILIGTRAGIWAVKPL